MKLMLPSADSDRPVTVWESDPTLSDPVWESAYSRFETEEEEIRKFRARLQKLGAEQWPRQSRIVDLFCGRGNGLKALERLGFQCLQGVDLSLNLAQRYRGPAEIFVGDCRRMRFPDASKDILIVQGGLHHLPRIPEDLHLVLSEAHRILVPGGRLALVEPWQTPFLQGVHALCSTRLARNLSPKINALATMIDRERSTYFNWLTSPGTIRKALDEYFDPVFLATEWGKIFYTGNRKPIQPQAC